MRRTPSLIAAALACAVLVGPRAVAQSIWSTTPTSGQLTNDANWQGGVAPANGTAWAFTNSSILVLTNGFTDFSVSGITFTADGNNYSLRGNAFTLTGNITNASTSQVTISNNLTVNSAILITNTTSGYVTLGGSLTGSGTIAYGATGTSGRLVLQGGSHAGFTGALIAGSGRVNIAANQSSAAADYTFNNTGGTFLTTSNTTYNFGSLSGSGTISANGNPFPNTLVIGAKDSSTVFSGNISSNFNGTNNLIKVGAGTLTLSGNNTYQGTTTISNGVLQLGTNGTTGSFSNTTSITLDGGSLAFNRSDNVTQGVNFLSNGSTLSGPGNLIQTGSGTLTLTAANTHRGTTRVEAGKLVLSNSLALQNSAFDTGGPGILSLAPGTTALTLGGLIGDGNFAPENYGAVTSLTLDVAAGITCTYSGVLSNGAEGLSLTKSGDGVQILTGDNTYSGATTVAGRHARPRCNKWRRRRPLRLDRGRHQRRARRGPFGANPRYGGHHAFRRRISSRGRRQRNSRRAHRERRIDHRARSRLPAARSPSALTPRRNG